MTDIQGQAGGAQGGRRGPPWYQRWQWWTAGVLVLVAATAGIATAFAVTTGPAPETTTTPGATAGTSTTTAAADLRVPLTEAFDAEQEAKATYDNVIAQFGAVAPFTTVRAAEVQHIATVQGLAQHYGVSLPSGPFTGLPAPATLGAACQMGVTTEQEVVAMYEQLLAEVTGYADVTTAFSNLQAVSRDHHLRAFEQCAASATTTPGTTAGATPTSSTTQASATLSAALTEAFDAEQEAKATYDNVIAQFGAVAPFTTVRTAEMQHIATVQGLAQHYGVSLPSGPFTGLPAPPSLTLACQMGVVTEQATVAMYEQLLAEVTGYADVTTAFSNLQAAARDNHLPAFEQCA